MTQVFVPLRYLQREGQALQGEGQALHGSKKQGAAFVYNQNLCITLGPGC